MCSPADFSRVLVSGRTDEIIVVPNDRLVLAADSCTSLDETVERNVPFNLLSATREPDATRTDSCSHEGRIAQARNILHSTFAQLSRSHHAVADLEEAIDSTLQMIHASRQIILESDSVIARARCGSLDDKPNPVPIP